MVYNYHRTKVSELGRVRDEDLQTNEDCDQRPGGPYAKDQSGKPREKRVDHFDGQIAHSFVSEREGCRE